MLLAVSRTHRVAIRAAQALWCALQSPWSIRRRLALMMLVAVLPLVLLLALAIAYTSHAARRAQESGLLYTARTLNTALDARLEHYLVVAEALARDPALLEEDLSDFRRQAEYAFPNTSDAWVVVADSHGQELLNLLQRPGEPLPHRSETAMAAQRQAFATRATVISDVFRGQVLGEFVATVNVPIFHDDRPFRTLAVAMDARGIARLMSSGSLPDGWLAGIIDSRGNFIARSPDHERYVGQPASEGWRANMQREGVAQWRSLEGNLIASANVRSRVSGWAVAVAVRLSTLNAPEWRTIIWTSLVALAICLASLLLAAAIARRITGPIVALEQQGRALVAGEPARLVPDLPEIDNVWETLKKAVAERDRHERDLRISEQQLRRAAEAAQFGAYDYDVRANTIHWSPQLKHLLGAEDIAEPIRLDAALAFVHPGDRDRVQALLQTIMHRTQQFYELEFRIVRGDEQVRWMMDRGQAIHDKSTSGSTRVVGILMDITERKQAEEQQHLMQRELTHRSKNMLAVVLAIANHTLRSSPDPAQFAAAFQGRIRGLAAAHDLLTHSHWRGADLAELVQVQLAPFLPAAAERRLKIEGPPVILSSGAATSFGLVLHELATNATKYGALSTSSGIVDLRWSVACQAQGERLLHFAWRERGGAPAQPPTHKGFGSTLIETSAVRFEPRYLPTGFECEIAVQLTPAGAAAGPAPLS
jgi:PAS domain S-box-containing protein